MRKAQSGQTLVMFALSMALIFLGFIALVGDADTLMVHYNRVNSAALLGAQAGATAINQADFYNGQRDLDPATAPGICQTAALSVLANATVACAVNGNQVTVTVSEQVNLPVPLFPGGSPTVSATRTGQAVFGGATPQ